MPAPAPPPVRPQPCLRPNCTGSIVDGFCTDCGRPPLGQSAFAAPSAAAMASGSSAVAPPPGALAPSPSDQTAAPSTSSPTAPALSALSQSTAPLVSFPPMSPPASTRAPKSNSAKNRGSTRRVLGAGLVAFEPEPSHDPLASVLADARVPARKRRCPHCHSQLSHDKGFCPMCGAGYSFLPALSTGDLVGGQYEVKGAIAFGGQGWVYLGWDTLLSRWVVLKGLLNAGDEGSARAALQERKFLASVKHPNIVSVYNFVTQGEQSYIVMEYVGGKSLKTLRQERGPLPPEHAIACVHRILGAFGHLERMGLVYCDFKPDNFMLEGDDVKLIDMGGVRSADDPGGDVYGTQGYSAPEASETPSAQADIYSVARTLAVLLITFPFSGKYEFSLPLPTDEPLFDRCPSLYRWLLKATRHNPALRFAGADEAAEELLGVLREIVASNGTPAPYDGFCFVSGEIAPGAALNDPGRPGYKTLPALKVDAADPAANALLLADANSDPQSREEAFKRIYLAHLDSSEAALRWADARLQAGDYFGAEALLAEVERADPHNWRPRWVRGCNLLAQDRPRDARALFDDIYSDIPGELAPKFALAVCAEAEGEYEIAARHYDLVAHTDPRYVEAIFGLARVLTQSGYRDSAVRALEDVPLSSRHYARARIALVRILIETRPRAKPKNGAASPARPTPGPDELVRAGHIVGDLRGTLDGYNLHRLSADVLLAGARALESHAFPPQTNKRLLGHLFTARALREGAEAALRACARFAVLPGERIALIDEANRERPRTLF